MGVEWDRQKRGYKKPNQLNQWIYITDGKRETVTKQVRRRPSRSRTRKVRAPCYLRMSDRTSTAEVDRVATSPETSARKSRIIPTGIMECNTHLVWPRAIIQNNNT